MHSSSRGKGSAPRWAAAVLLLLAMAAGAVAAGWNAGWSRPARLTIRSVLDGTWAAARQSSFEDGLPLRDAAVSLWTLAKWRLFREAGQEVRAGSDGWLFSIEELEPPAGLSTPIDAAVRRIGAVRDALAARGIDLVVALVPAKAAVETRSLGGLVVPPALAGRYARVREALRSSGVPAPDLLGPLAAGAAAGAAGGESMYLRTDTHWTPRGARTAAAALAPVVDALLDEHAAPRASFALVPGEPVRVLGDLLKFVPLGPWERFGPAPDTVTPHVPAADAAGGAGAADAPGAGLFGAVTIPVALVGTSYSVSEVSGFEPALRDAVDADVLNVAAEGRGPFAPMDAYLSGGTIDDPRPDVVVWEIPERYIVP